MPTVHDGQIQYPTLSALPLGVLCWNYIRRANERLAAGRLQLCATLNYIPP